MLVREGRGIWPACTVYYRYLSCWAIQPETVWNFHSLRFGLTKQEEQQKDRYCFHAGVSCFSVLQRSEQVEITACRLFQSLNQNSNVVFFYLFTFHTLALASFLSLKNHLPTNYWSLDECSHGAQLLKISYLENVFGLKPWEKLDEWSCHFFSDKVTMGICIKNCQANRL